MNRCNRCMDCDQGRRCAFSTQISGAVLGEVIGLVLAFLLVLVVVGLVR